MVPWTSHAHGERQIADYACRARLPCISWILRPIRVEQGRQIGRRAVPYSGRYHPETNRIWRVSKAVASAVVLIMLDDAGGLLIYRHGLEILGQQVPGLVDGGFELSAELICPVGRPPNPYLHIFQIMPVRLGSVPEFFIKFFDYRVILV